MEQLSISVSKPHFLESLKNDAPLKKININIS